MSSPQLTSKSPLDPNRHTDIQASSPQLRPRSHSVPNPLTHSQISSPKLNPEVPSEANGNTHDQRRAASEPMPQPEETSSHVSARTRLLTDTTSEEEGQNKSMEQSEVGVTDLESETNHDSLSSSRPMSVVIKSEEAELRGVGHHEVIDLREDNDHNAPALDVTHQAGEEELEVPSVESAARSEKTQKDLIKLEPIPNDAQADVSLGEKTSQFPPTCCTVPERDLASSELDAMEWEETPENQFALPHLEHNDMTWDCDASNGSEVVGDPVPMLRTATESLRDSLPKRVFTEHAGSVDNDMANQSLAGSDEDHIVATRKFEKLEKYYNQRKMAGLFSDVDEIDCNRACRREAERNRRREKHTACCPTPETENVSMFFSDDDEFTAGLDKEGDDEARSAYLRGRDDDLDLELVSWNSNGAGKKAASRRSTSSTKRTAVKGKVTKPKKNTKRAQKPRTFAGMNSLIKNSNDLVDIAHANQEKPRQPTFTSTNKATALKELISSMPEEQRKIHHVDKKELESASKKFHGVGAVKSDGLGGWKLRGMKSSLRNYQLLGAAFMRDREQGERPYGGFVADEMGLGKTVLAIANIIAGRAACPDRKAKTTLVVAPSALLTQWLSEVNKHADKSKLQQVLLYRSAASLQVRDPEAELGRQDVVITSYHEVLRSWPKNTPPLHLMTQEAKQDWWADQCKNNIGVLHRMTFERVVLDEAHAIKNHLSRTSEAVCQLKGKFRWAISGTPIQNKLEEFYAFFRFIHIPHTGSFEAFQKNFCKRGSTLALQRLQYLLSRYMLRRTHEDQLLGAPILTLPDIRSTTVVVKFSHIEKAIYAIIRERFINEIKTFIRNGTIEKKYRTIFVLMLRLRQVTAHVLLVQKTLKELMAEPDLERLWKLTEADVSVEDQTLARGLRQALVMNARDSDAPQTLQSDDSVGPIRSRFRRYLQSLREDGRWKEITDRTLCTSCKDPPAEPYITSCNHIYCHRCLNDLIWIAAQEKDKNGSRCIDCGVNFDRSEPCSREDFASERGSVGADQQGITKAIASPEEVDVDWFTLNGPIMQSAKTKAAVSQIEQWFQEDESKKQARSKIIVFTQFKGMIKVMDRVCKERRWGSVMFHGDMSFNSRDNAIKRFSEDDDCFILIAGLKAGGVGLNLTAGSRVIIFDLWWNQFVETQAFCRVYRIGQVREVEVVRFVVEDSIDQDIVAMQERKNEEIDLAVESKNHPARLSTRDLLKLFATDLERDVNDNPIAGVNEEPFVLTDDPYHQENYADDESD